MLKICYKYKYCVKIINTSIDIFSMVNIASLPLLPMKNFERSKFEREFGGIPNPSNV